METSCKCSLKEKIQIASILSDSFLELEDFLKNSSFSEDEKLKKIQSVLNNIAQELELNFFDASFLKTICWNSSTEACAEALTPFGKVYLHRLESDKFFVDLDPIDNWPFENQPNLTTVDEAKLFVEERLNRIL